MGDGESVAAVAVTWTQIISIVIFLLVLWSFFFVFLVRGGGMETKNVFNSHCKNIKAGKPFG